MISGVIVSQVAAYGIFAFLFIRIIIPELKAVRESPFLDYAIKQAKRKKYLVTYVVLNLISAAFLFYAFWDGPVQNPFQFGPTSTISFVIAYVLGLIAFIILLQWIFDFFRQGKSGLFQDLYLSGSRVQDAARPFMWILFILVVALFIIESFAIMLEPTEAEPLTLYDLFLGIVNTIAYVFAMLSFFFYVATVRVGVPRILLYLFAAGFVFAILLWVLTMTFALMSGLFPAGLLDLLSQNPKIFGVFISAATTIAIILIGWFFYAQFMKAEPGPWIEKTG